MIQEEGAVNACLSKAQIMLNLNQLDSASYFYNKNMSQLDIYGKAVCYDGMYQIAKKKGSGKLQQRIWIYTKFFMIQFR